MHSLVVPVEYPHAASLAYVVDEVREALIGVTFLLRGRASVNCSRRGREKRGRNCETHFLRGLRSPGWGHSKREVSESRVLEYRRRRICTQWRRWRLRESAAGTNGAQRTATREGARKASKAGSKHRSYIARPRERFPPFAYPRRPQLLDALAIFAE